MDLTKSWSIAKYRRTQQPHTQSRRLAIEEPLTIRVNDQTLAVLMRLPGDDIELAVGFCFTEDIIASMDEVLMVRHCPEEENLVELRITADVSLDQPLFIPSACASRGVVDIARERLVGKIELSLNISASPQILYELPKQMHDYQSVYASAGGVHAAAVYSLEGEMVVVREDVGRHNALDKVVGHCLLSRLDCKDKILVTTGRATSEMILKAAAAGSPLVASTSGVTSLGVELAEELGVTLIAYLRGGTMNLYTHPFRIANE